jgi:hypothetical protein
MNLVSMRFIHHDVKLSMNSDLYDFLWVFSVQKSVAIFSGYDKVISLHKRDTFIDVNYSQVHIHLPIQ